MSKKGKPKKKAAQRKTQNPAVVGATPPIVQTVHGDRERAQQVIAQLEETRGRRVIVYWLTDQARVSEAAVIPLYDHLSRIGKQEAIDLVVYTRGGDTEVPWRFVSLIREFCERLGVLVPYRAYSAGTLIAMGADEIVMTPLGVLSPIDPSRTHPLLPKREGAPEAEPISVQDMRHAMQFIREAAGQGTEMPYTPEALAQIFTALFEKIHPLAIGAIEQSYALAKLIGKQCLRTHMDPAKEDAQINAIVDHLCDDYKSHAYQISRQEARDIGLNVIDAPRATEAAMTELLTFYLSRRVPPESPPGKGQTVALNIAWMDSTDVFMTVQAQYRAEDQGRLEYLGDEWKSY
jgi:hypothetical protein